MKRCLLLIGMLTLISSVSYAIGFDDDGGGFDTEDGGYIPNPVDLGGGTQTGSGSGVVSDGSETVSLNTGAVVGEYMSAGIEGSSLHWEIYRPGRYTGKGATIVVQTNLPWLIVMAEGVANLKKESKWWNPDKLEVAYALTEDNFHEPAPNEWKTPCDLIDDPILIKSMGTNNGMSILHLWAQVNCEENDEANSPGRPYEDFNGFTLTFIQLPMLED